MSMVLLEFNGLCFFLPLFVSFTEYSAPYSVFFSFMIFASLICIIHPTEYREAYFSVG